ncbi:MULTISPECIES: alpha/beta fold hydrolase [unclassified Burkholderia]|uniref:alpha/beta fold hydrolase n=1 Tax=unclassified Burkholderia TaxID=2613784 RepID=UPI00075ED622|nr:MULTISPECIES: alpha/beta fold hydrolase [unclassified Burkholderia]KVN11364.1 short chain dehydrogenase [Burkholderia sp. MSMB1552]KWZ50350.1 short chain dehydrogenase [Burkholderia sp. MSMB1588]
MSDNFKALFDRLRNGALDEADGIALLARLRDALRADDAGRAGGAAPDATGVDAARLPRFATPHWHARPYREASAQAFDTVLLVGQACVAAAWGDELAATFPGARIVRIEADAQAPDATRPEPAFRALDAVGDGARVAVLLIDDLAPERAEHDAHAPDRYLACVLSAFALVRDLLGRPIARCHLLHLTPLRHALPIGAAWHGLAKSAALESPRFASGGVWLSNADLGRATPALAARELAELAPGQYRDIGWIDGRRCERALAAKTDALVAPAAEPFSRGETVLITGGAGALGLAIAARLTSRFALRVVLCGRRSADALDARQRDWLARHPAVRYVCADVSDATRVRALLAEFGGSAPLAAIFHAAGAIDDAPLRAKPLDAIRSVLAPKVLGTQLLDRHAARLGVRYFVCFSSIASLAGSAGQADYASGNGFMDEYCRLRQAAADAAGGCRYLSINWPYWLEGGMHADPRRLERLAADSGLTPLGMDEGIDSLLTLLQRPAPQVVVLPGERAAIDRVFLSTPQPPQPPQTPAARGAADDLQDGLRELVARTLKMETEAIDADTPFSNYGFDSILLTELATTIGQRYPGLALEVGVFLDHPTLRELGDWLRARLQAARAGDGDTRASRPGAAAPRAADTLLDGLRAQASAILKLPVADIGIETPWSEFGFDSISLNEFATLIARDFPTRPLATDLFLSCSTLAELAAHLAARPSPAAPGAHRAHESAPPHADPAPAAAEEIAIIGMAGRFPGANDLAGFWRNLVENRTAVTTIPEDRWRWQDYAAGEPGKTDCRHAAFLTAIDRFDAAHFRISPREAELMDPQQRLLLECAWEAFENAAIAPDSIRGRRIGLFFGAEKNDYLSLIADADVDVDPYINTGNAHAMLANRVSFFFGLTGPSVTLNTACSSSMAAIRAAVASLRSAESEMALAGGVNILLSPGLFVLNRKMGMLTASDHIKPFDRDASGHLFGEGLGLVLLKPLRQALRDGDPVHGVIRAVDVTHGGQGRFLTAPHAPSHEALIRSVLAQAGASPAEVDYLEAQGSGDQLTDRMELEVYHALYGARAGGEPLPIGSVKGHIGHLGAASGVTALIKVLLCLSHDRLLPVLHHRHLNWRHDEPFAGRLLTEHAEWRPKQIDGRRVPRVAAVHNFGYGGVNGHLLVRESLPALAVDACWPAVARLWVMSARTAVQLRQSVERLVAYLRDGGHRLHGQREPGVESIAWTLQAGRQPLNHRLALLVDDAPAADALRAALARLEAWLEDGRGDARLLTGIADGVGPAHGEACDDVMRIAARWVGGARIDWAACYGDTRPMRLSLPSYPFAATRHWVTPRGGDGAGAPRGGPAAPMAAAIRAGAAPGARPRAFAALHPLLHGLSGADRSLRFVSTFSGDEPFFRDHRVRGVPTLPGAAYCEMFVAAAALATPECERHAIGYRLDNVVWTRPLAAADGMAGIAVTMEPVATQGRQTGVDGRDAFRFTVGSARADDAQPYAQGIAVRERIDAISAPPAVVVEQLPVYTRGAQIDGARLYRRFAELGFDYGPSHRCIDALFHDGEEVLARMRALEPDAPGTAGYLLVPGLLDSALQASIGFGLAALDAARGSAADGAAMPLLPFALERLRCHRAPGPSGQVRWVRLRRRAGAAGSPVVKLDVDLLDADGRAWASLEGYSARRVKPDTAASVAPASSHGADKATTVPMRAPAAWRDDGGARVYPCRFAPDDRYLRAHRIDGQALLPAVALLDLARIVAETLPHDSAEVLRIGRATWHKPLFVSAPGRDAVLHVVARDDAWAVTLESGEGEDEPASAHAQCELGWVAAAPGADVWHDLAHGAAAPHGLAGVVRRFGGSLAGETGDVPRLPNRVRIVDGDADGDTVRLTLACETPADAAADTAGASMFDLLFAIVDLCGRDGAANGLAVPYGIDECLLYRAFPRQVRVAIRTAPGVAGARTRSCDIRVADLDGRPVMRLKRLVMVTLREDAAPSAASRAADIADAAHDAHDARPALQCRLRELIGALQKIDPDEIGIDDDLTQCGLDSFSFTELSNRLNRRFAIDTMPTMFFEHGTVRALADGLLRAYPNLAVGLLTECRAERRDASRPATAAPSVAQGAEAADCALSPARAPGRAAGDGEAIAIVGMAVRFPGARTLDAFRQRLIAPHGAGNGAADELDAAASNPAGAAGDDATPAARPDAGTSNWFGADPAALPADRPLVAVLETAWHVFEDAGMAPAALHGSDTAVYLGVSSPAKHDVQVGDAGLPAAVPALHALPNRISFEFDFRGPSHAIDTGCSSSLAALARGVEHLRQRRGALVVAGGVGPIASHDADGAIGMVLLKRIDDALRDGDRIHAVIAAVAENHGGRTLSPAAPSVDAQRELLVAAYRRAGVDVARIGHVEAHGAGTALADAIEREALCDAFAELRGGQAVPADAPRCTVGSLGRRFGPLGAASGMAGVIKTALMLRLATIPGHPLSPDANPGVDLAGSGLAIAGDASQPWPATRDGQPRCAGVSSFGAGGANAHAVLLEYRAAPDRQDGIGAPASASRVFLLSAHSEPALRAQARALAAHIARHVPAGEAGAAALRDIAYTLQTGRDALAWRFGVVARTSDALQQQLRLFGDAAAGTEAALADYRVARVAEARHEFDGDEDVRALARQWLEKGKLAYALRLWLDGIAVDWRAAWDTRAVALADLPSYPFDHALTRSEARAAGDDALDALDARVRHLLVDGREGDGAANGDPHADARTLMQRVREVGDLLGVTLSVGDAYRHRDVGALRAGLRKRARRDELAGTAAAPAPDDPFARYYRMAFGALDGFGRELLALDDEVVLDILHNVAPEKPPLLLLMPMACLGTAWLHQVRAFAADHSVIVCHYPDHAASTGADALRATGDGLDGVARLFWTALDRLGVDAPVHLVGWSLGGLVAQCMAGADPGRVASMTLVNALDAPGRDGIDRAMRVLVDEISTQVMPEVDRHFEGDPRAIKACYDARILDVYLGFAADAAAQARLADPPFPVLVLAGGCDRVVPPEVARRLHARLGGAALELLDEAGHYLPMTHAGWFNARLRQHLEVTV